MWSRLVPAKLNNFVVNYLCFSVSVSLLLSRSFFLSIYLSLTSWKVLTTLMENVDELKFLYIFFHFTPLDIRNIITSDTTPTIAPETTTLSSN